MSITGYSKLQIVLHWAVALLILHQVVSHEAVLGLLGAAHEGRTPTAVELVLGRTHVALGLAVFVLGAVRLGVRLRRGAPPPPPGEPPLRTALAKLSHVVLYALILLMPVSGALAWFGGVELAARAHAAAKFLLIPFVALHVAGAVYHRFGARDGVFERMIRPVRE